MLLCQQFEPRIPDKQENSPAWKLFDFDLEKKNACRCRKVQGYALMFANKKEITGHG